MDGRNEKTIPTGSSVEWVNGSTKESLTIEAAKELTYDVKRIRLYQWESQ